MPDWRIKCRCLSCGARYSAIRKADSEEALAMKRDPPCPKCRKRQKAVRGMDVSEGKAPSVGGSIPVRAMDETMRIVSEDQGFTDLRTTVHEGESMAPALPPRLQSMADNFFSPKARPRGGQNMARMQMMQGAIQNAMSGQALREQESAGGVNPVAELHAKPWKPTVIAEYDDRNIKGPK